MIGSVESDYVRRAALVQYPEFGDDLLLDGRLHLQVDHLLGHDHTGRFVTNAVNDTCKNTIDKYVKEEIILVKGCWRHFP